MLRKISIILILNLLFLVDLKSYVQTRIFNSHVGQEMLADDTVIAKEKLNLTVDGVLKGSGRFESPNINMKVSKFEFTGTIDCNGECNITAKEPFNENMFKRSGTGKFIIKIDPNIDLNRSQEIVTPTISTDLPSWVTAKNKPEPEMPSKKYELNGSIFTVIGQWNINIAENIIKNDLEQIRALLEKKPEIKNNPYELGIFMLISGLYGHIELVEEFIKLGADVNGSNVKYGPGQQHLISAVLTNNPHFVSSLIKAGANPNIEYRYDPLLIVAVKQDNPDVVRALLQSPSINIEGKLRGWHFKTALMCAAKRGNIEIVKLLLEAGANIENKTRRGRTALDKAIKAGHRDIANLIKEYKKTKNHESASIEAENQEQIEEKKDNNWLDAGTKNVLTSWVTIGGVCAVILVYQKYFKK